MFTGGIHVSEQRDFILWLRDEIKDKGWRQSDFAKKAGLAPSTVSMVLKMQKKAGVSFCKRTANALNLPPGEVLKRAGHIPDTQQAISDDPTFKKIIEVVRSLSPGQRQDVYEYLLLYQEQQTRKTAEAPRSH